MGPFGNFSQLFPIHGPQTVPVHGFGNVAGAWSGANVKGGLSLAGGHVILTDSHLVFTPWDMSQTRQWLLLAGRIFDWTGAGIINAALNQTGLLEPVVIPLTQIANFQPFLDNGWLKPPMVQFLLASGRSFTVGIVESPSVIIGSSKNQAAAMNFILTLRRVMGLA